MKFLEKIENLINERIIKLGADEKVNLSFSDRPELSDFQTNVAFSLSKTLRKAPISIANEIAQDLEFEEQDMVSDLSLLWHLYKFIESLSIIHVDAFQG